ncbi:m131/m129 protein [Murid betaherpesvirus 1]|nr:m131/m129 protein [Murid betaherpesvirus 1]
MGTLLVCCLVCCVVLVASTVAEVGEPCCARPQLHPLPLYAVQSAEYTDTECGQEVVFTTFSGMRVCAKRAVWSDTIVCLLRSRSDSRRRLLLIFGMILKAFNTTTTIKVVPVDSGDMMYVADIMGDSPRITVARYSYDVKDGNTWIECVCEITLIGNGTNWPLGIHPFKPTVWIEYTLQVAFSSKGNDPSSRCIDSAHVSGRRWNVDPPDRLLDFNQYVATLLTPPTDARTLLTPTKVECEFKNASVTLRTPYYCMPLRSGKPPEGRVFYSKIRLPDY